jgi:hypothetical protein
MRRTRPCRIWRRWFVPHPRAGDRQHVCSAADCQRERHRRACQRWRQREVPAERAHRLRQRLRVDGAGGQAVAAHGRLSWDAVRDAVGLEVSVILEEISRLLEDVVRDAVRRQVGAPATESRQVQLAGRRDDMVSAARTP